MVLAIGVALLVPLVISWLYGDGFWRNFLLPGAAMIALGGTGILVNRLPWSRAVDTEATTALVLLMFIGRCAGFIAGG